MMDLNSSKTPQKKSLFVTLTLLLFVGMSFYPLQTRSAFVVPNSKNNSALTFETSFLKKSLDPLVRDSNWPDMISLGKMPLKIEYTLNRDLNDYVKKLLKKYRSDYSTVVVIDNETGNILSAVGYEQKTSRFNNNLIFSSTHPSASLFKIVTSAELLKSNKVDVETHFTFIGRGTTLYKRQLREPTSLRWARPLTFRSAFAHSNNVIFARAAIQNLSPTEIYKMANDFGFNQELMDEVTLPQSFAFVPNDQYKMAQLASGYNDETKMSPIHGALLASVFANDGVMRFPNLVTRIYSPETGETFWSKQLRDRRVLDRETSLKMRELMNSTIDEGTGRRGFRRMGSMFKTELEIGGKSGHITGGIPFGKRDWFTAFAVPKKTQLGRGISICVMNVNVKRWHVRSSALAKEVIEYYYRTIDPLKDKLTKIPKSQEDPNQV